MTIPFPDDLTPDVPDGPLPIAQADELWRSQYADAEPVADRYLKQLATGVPLAVCRNCAEDTPITEMSKTRVGWCRACTRADGRARQARLEARKKAQGK